MQRRRIPESGFIDDLSVLSELHIIDFGRMNGGMFGSDYNAMRAIYNYVQYGYTYTIGRFPLSHYPEQPGFPGWRHAGNHEAEGRLFWNMFKTRFPDATLRFHDSPDFSGEMVLDGFPLTFYGDIGKVSPIAFFETVMVLNPGDLWISVLGGEQVILSPTGNAHVVKLFRDFEDHSSQPVTLDEFLPTIGYRLDFTIQESTQWLVDQRVWTPEQRRAYLKSEGHVTLPQQLALFQ